MTFDISTDGAVITGAVLSRVTITVALAAALPAASDAVMVDCYLSISCRISSSDHDRTAYRTYHRHQRPSRKASSQLHSDPETSADTDVAPSTIAEISNRITRHDVPTYLRDGSRYHWRGVVKGHHNGGQPVLALPAASFRR